MGMWKDVQTKMAMLQESIQVVKDSVKSQTGNWNERLNTLQRKADETELKVISMESSVEKVMEHNLAIGSKPAEEGAADKIANVQVQMELNAIKEQLQEERKKRDTQLEDLQRAHTESENKLRTQLYELARSLQRTQDTNPLANLADKPITKGPAQGATKGEVEYVNAQVVGVERRVDGEMAKRVKMEADLLKYLDEKLSAVRDKQKQEEKASLEREKKMLGNLQEGLVTINDIVKGTNEETALKLSKVETQLTHHLEALTQLVENTNRAFAGDIAKQGEDLRTLKQKLAEVEETSLSNVQNLANSLQAEAERLETLSAESSKKVNERVDDLVTELQRHEKLVALVKDEVHASLAEEKKWAEQHLTDLQADIHKTQNYVRERTVMLKHDVDEAKKEMAEKVREQERVLHEEVGRVEKFLNKRVDEFAIKTDESVRTHMSQTVDTLNKIKEAVEANKKANDEHIRQQGNSIKALCRALTEKEAAERKQAVDELGLRIAKRFTQLESDTNKRFLSQEVELKTYADKKAQQLEQSLQADIQSRLAIERVLNTLESAERQQQDETLREGLQNHIATFDKAIADSQAQFKDVKAKLDQGVKELKTALTAAKADCEAKFARQDEKAQRTLEALNEEVAHSTTNDITTAISLNSIESRFISSMEALERANIALKKELQALIELNSQQLTSVLNTLKKDLDEAVATSVAEEIAHKAVTNAIEDKLSKEVPRIEDSIQAKALAIEALARTQNEKAEELRKKLETTEKSLEEVGKKAEEMATKIGSMETQVGQVEGKVGELNTIQETTDKKIAEVAQSAEESAKKQEADFSEKLAALNKKVSDSSAQNLAAIEKKIEEKSDDFNKKFENTNKRITDVEGQVVAALVAQTGKDEDATEKKLGEVGQHLEQMQKQQADLALRVDKAEEKGKQLETAFDAKIKEVVGTVNNEVESFNKKVENDVSHVMIELEKKMETSIKAHETRLAVLEAASQK